MRYDTYYSGKAWRVELWPQVADWLENLTDKEYASVMAALDALSVDGPSLGRPFVDHVKSSKHKNMKELRPLGQHIRLLFAFDPTRSAVVLVAGDKTNDWSGWYASHVPIADKRFDQHLARLARERN